MDITSVIGSERAAPTRGLDASRRESGENRDDGRAFGEVYEQGERAPSARADQRSSERETEARARNDGPTREQGAEREAEARSRDVEDRPSQEAAIAGAQAPAEEPLPEIAAPAGESFLTAPPAKEGSGEAETTAAAEAETGVDDARAAPPRGREDASLIGQPAAAGGRPAPTVESERPARAEISARASKTPPAQEALPQAAAPNTPRLVETSAEGTEGETPLVGGDRQPEQPVRLDGAATRPSDEGEQPVAGADRTATAASAPASASASASAVQATVATSASGTAADSAAVHATDADVATVGLSQGALSEGADLALDGAEAGRASRRRRSGRGWAYGPGRAPRR